MQRKDAALSGGAETASPDPQILVVIVLVPGLRAVMRARMLFLVFALRGPGRSYSPGTPFGCACDRASSKTLLTVKLPATSNRTSVYLPIFGAVHCARILSWSPRGTWERQPVARHKSLLGKTLYEHQS